MGRATTALSALIRNDMTQIVKQLFISFSLTLVSLQALFRLIMKNLILFSCLFCSPTLLANIYYDSDWDMPAEWQLTPTLSYEANSVGSFTNIGLKWGGNAHSGSHIELVSNLSFFNDDSPYNRDISFTNFDASVRFGVFDRLNIYGELGIALDELFTDDNDDDYYNDYWGGYDDPYHKSSRPDWFAGVGAGWHMDWLTVNFYARYRYLESLEEQYLLNYFTRNEKLPDRYQWFTGVELSINF